MKRKAIQTLFLYLSASFGLLCLLCTQSVDASYQQVAAETKQNASKRINLTSHVVLIIISGLRADYANNPAAFRLKIPHLQSLRSTGSYAYAVESVYPSQNIPAHATIVTGVLPSDHGITSDHPFEEKNGQQSATPFQMASDIKADTIWAAAKRLGLVTAAVGFPLTVNADINFNLPETQAESADGMNAYPAGLYDEILSVLRSKSDFIKPISKSDYTSQTADAFNAEAAVYLIEKHHPNLLMINFKSFDLAQQRFGLLSNESSNALTFIDTLIGKILTSSERAQSSEGTTFLVASDHGSSKVEREFRPNVLLEKSGFLTSDGKGNIKSWRAVTQSFGGSAAIFIENPQDEKLAGQIKRLFDQLDRDSDNPLWRIISRNDAARLGADPRAVFFLEAAPPYQISASLSGSTISKIKERAAHGYLPSRAEMRGALFISGRGIKAGQRIEYARLIDIAPTIARLLGLELKTARGRVLTEVIAP